jgi:hypothetical protein
MEFFFFFFIFTPIWCRCKRSLVTLVVSMEGLQERLLLGLTGMLVARFQFQFLLQKAQCFSRSVFHYKLGGRSVGIVRSRTQATEFFYVFCYKQGGM